MAGFYLGVDIGNTKSHVLIVDESGQAVGFGTGGPGNHEVLGVEGFRSTLHTVVERATTQADLTVADLSGVGFGIAGFDWPSDRSLMAEVIDTLNINAPYNVVNDAMMGLIAGAKQGWGVSVSAGTSSNARGRDRNGRIGRMTGNGAFFGEYGGGLELVMEGVAAISRAWSMRGPETALSQTLIEHVGATSVSDFLEGLARGRYEVRATDAPVVFETARTGDPVAQEAIRRIGRGLGDLAVGIIRQLDFETLEFEVVMAGSFYKGSPLVAQAMAETICPVAPGATLVRLDAPPVVGAALLGMEQAKVDFISLRDRVIETTNPLLAKSEY
jgi:N-acetylglucosamine kinase-like BadF-type ATPase